MCRRHLIEVLILAALAAICWLAWWLVNHTHAAGRAGAIAVSAWTLLRIDPRCIDKLFRAAFCRKGLKMNIEAWIESNLGTLALKAFSGMALTPAQQAIVTNAVAANTKLAMLLVEVEGTKLLAKSHPEVATALAGILTPPAA